MGPPLASHRHHRRAQQVPMHLGVVMDGNRRWARAAGIDPQLGHRRGAEHVSDLLDWCESWGIEHLSVYMLSADNIRKRDAGEIENLMELAATILPERIDTEDRDWSLHLSGDRSLLAPRAAAALESAVRSTEGRSRHLTVAIGYDGRQDVVTAVRRLAGEHDLHRLADTLTEEHITAALDGGPNKGIDLVIRTSGEERLSGFFPWQSTRAQVYVSTRMWPAFDATDFAAAIAWYGRQVGRAQARATSSA